MKKYFNFNDKKAIIFSIIGVSILLFLVIGASYAYFIAIESNSTTSANVVARTNDNISVVATGNTTLSMNLDLNDMRKFGTTRKYYATSSGKSTTETSEPFININSRSSSAIYCTYTGKLINNNTTGKSNMIDQIRTSGVLDEMVLELAYNNTVINKFDMKTTTWDSNNQIIFTGVLKNIPEFSGADLKAKLYLSNLAAVDQASYLANSAINLKMELTKINCDSMDSPMIESLAINTNDIEKIDVTMAAGGYELKNYCINQSERDTANCSWVSNNSKTFTVPIIGTTNDGIYFLHVKDIRGNIADSAGFDVKLVLNQKITNFPYSGHVESMTIPVTGNYKLEVWGAQGGTYNSYPGGLGGYSVGTIKLTSSTKIFINVGGTTNSFTGGTNGGGAAIYNGKGGGGATDIRISDSLYGRVIVAGAGGGSGVAYNGGYGGGLAGGDGFASLNRNGTGGTQTTFGTSFNNTEAHYGSFGVGGSLSVGYSAGGGGGGWYGGGGAYDPDADSDGRGGGGGSGYVYTSSTAVNYPSGCLLTNKHYLTDANTYGGNTLFVSPIGANETGHTGDGYARITALQYYKITLY